MALSKFQKKRLAAARNGGSQTQVIVKHNPNVVNSFTCVTCNKEKPRACFSKNTLKIKNFVCMNCQEFYDTATTKGHFDENGWVETAPKVNDEIYTWDFEEGRKLYPSASANDICINSPFPRPAKLTKYPTQGEVAALLTAATITEKPTGKLKFKSLGLDIPKPKVEDDEWGTWEAPTVKAPPPPRPHHEPILTDAMQKEMGVGKWGKSGRKTNIIVPQFARGGAGIDQPQGRISRWS